MSKFSVRLLISLGIATGAMIIFAWCLLHNNYINFKAFTPGFIRDQVLSFGPWAAFVYIGVYVINAILIFPPNAPISLSAGLIFGHYWGVVLILISALIATSITFWIGRSFERKFLDRILQGRWKDISEKLENNGFATVILLRIIPIVPFEILNYLCGLSRIRYKDYFWGTFLGMIPGAVVIGFFGGTLGDVNGWGDLFSPKIMVGIGLLIILFLVPSIYYFVKSQNLKK